MAEADPAEQPEPIEQPEAASLGDAGRPGLSGKHAATRAAVFANPVRANIKQRDVEALLVALGATIHPGGGSAIAVKLGDAVLFLHRPHPRPDMDKGAVKSVRRFLSGAGF